MAAELDVDTFTQWAKKVHIVEMLGSVAGWKEFLEWLLLHAPVQDTGSDTVHLTHLPADPSREPAARCTA